MQLTVPRYNNYRKADDPMAKRFSSNVRVQTLFLTFEQLQVPSD